MRKLTILTIVLTIFFTACKRTDSPVSEVEKVIAIQRQIAKTLTDSSYAQLKSAELTLNKLKSAPDSLLAENNYLLGLYFRKENQLDSAAVYFHHATDFVNDSIKREREGTYFEAAWNAYYNLGRSGDCFTISEKFKSMLNHEKQYKSLSWAYYWEEYTYLMSKNYQKALAVNEARVQIARERDTANLPAALIGLANLKYDYLRDKSGAISILESLIYEDEKLAPNIKRRLYTNYGVYTYYEGNYSAALTNYLKALENAKIDSNLDKVNGIANCYNNISEVLIDLKDYGLAQKYLDSTRLLGISNLSQAKHADLLNYELRLAIESSKSSKRINQLHQEIYSFQDERYTLQSQDELLALTKANEQQKILLQEKQDAEITSLKLQTRSIILAVSLFLLTIVGLLFYRQRKLKFEKEGLQLQQRLFRSQMNPHFTYNTLYAIKREIRKSQINAESYIVKFSRLLRLILENSMNDYVLLEKELEAIKKYLDLQLLHTSNKFEYKIGLENLEEDDLIFIPPMLLQPIIENCIEHGFSNLTYPGEIKITLRLEDDFLHCNIEDNGTEVNSVHSGDKVSASTQLISEFLENTTKTKVKVYKKTLDVDKETGTIVSFLIPYKLNDYD